MSDITPSAEEKTPTMEELRAQNAALHADLAARAKREEQYLAALASVDTAVRSRAKPESEQRQEDDEEPLDPAVQKRLERELAKVQAANAQQYSTMQDQMDSMAFGQMAATMGLSQEDYVEAEKQFATFRSRGVSIVDDTGTRRPLTRIDVLDRILAQRARGEMMKAAPERNLQALRGKIVGQATFDHGGSYEGAPRFVKLDEGLDAAPNKDRVAKLEKTLGNLEF